MKIRVKTVVVGVAILFGVIIIFNFIKGYMIKRFFANYSPPAVSVSSITAKQQNWEPQINAVGNFNAINGVEVNSQVSGSVVAIHFNSGQYIEANKPLIDIDDSIDQAVLKANQSELALQEINYKRQTDLLKRGATPGSSVDEARAKLLEAQAEVEKAKASIRHKHIATPFAGQLGIRQVNLGQYITPGQTEIVTLQSMDPLYLNFHLPEQLLNRLHTGQLITFSVEKNPNLIYEGKITAINSRIDIKTHNIQVQATVPNCPLAEMQDPIRSPLLKVKKREQDGKMVVTCNTALNTKNNVVSFNFIPGMFAAIEVEQPPIPNQIVLPTTAISYSLYGNSVYIIENDKDKNDQLFVKRVFVTTGDQQGNYTVIKKGVKPGQRIVNSGELKLQDGTPVVINNSVQLKNIVNPDELGE